MFTHTVPASAIDPKCGGGGDAGLPRCTRWIAAVTLFTLSNILCHNLCNASLHGSPAQLEYNSLLVSSETALIKSRKYNYVSSATYRKGRTFL